MITTSDFKKGQRVEIDAQPYVVLEATSHSPTARGANTLVRVRLRNILTGQQTDRTFKSGEKFRQPDVQFRAAAYLYSDGEQYHFMDAESYEQFSLPAERLGEEAGFLVDNLEVRALLYNGTVAAVELPHTVNVEIAECEPGVKGDTVANVTKPARLVSGAVVQVPLFVEQGELITVDTREGRYVRRASA
jgi:elongation factor P